MENRRLDPDYNPQEDIEDRLARIVAKSMRGVQIEYNDGGGNASWQKWILGILATLAAIGVVGGIGMYGQLSALTQKVEGLKEQVDRVQKIVEPKYRNP